MGKPAFHLITPLPRPSLRDLNREDHFWPSPEMEQWVRDIFIERGPLHNVDHEHLEMASIGFLFARIDFMERGQRILGTAQMGDPGGKAWAKGQRFQQLAHWFNGVPDFLITLDATFIAGCTNVEACAVIEHELYHCGQAHDKHGDPRFDKDGNPMFWIRPHDVEEFSGVAKRYGAWSPGLQQLIKDLSAGPTIAQVYIDGVCSCGKGF